MKSNITYIFLLLITTLSSCSDDFLEKSPSDKLSAETFWKTETDALMALNGCYNGWESYPNIRQFDTSSDNAYQRKSPFKNIGNGDLMAASTLGVYGTWFCKDNLACWFDYRKIRKYNDFISRVADIEMNEEKKVKYISEVRFLRAYDYFWKYMMYGDMPLVVNVFNNSDEAKMKRGPKEDIAKFILDELSEVSEHLPVANCVTSKGRITRGAALALKARFELFLGMYKEAQEDAEKVINMSCYKLYDNYTSLFYPKAERNDNETILKIEYSPDTNPQRLPQLGLPCLSGGWCAVNATWDMVEAFQMENGKFIDEPNSGYDKSHPFSRRDSRLKAQILVPGEVYDGRIYNPLDTQIDGNDNVESHVNRNASPSGLLVVKGIYPMSMEEMNNFGADIAVIRLPEMYVTYAEAALHTGNGVDKAISYLNLQRDRVGMPPISELNQRIVRYERRVELAFEGLRYFDIKRWNLGPEVLNGDCMGCPLGTIDKEGNITWTGGQLKLETRFFYPERNYLLPIPQAELDRNPNMIQNEGY